ncbi:MULTISPECIES: hypothetical protein [Cyanophyceae]|uniref:Uncharacterized protein n=1 Tax=Leptolyngbya subtilissima DQ-A4 TaxID=2933933 RepID=A0ABV0KBI5_9CYAN|nr:hypothetical protein [Nodosilinea sp. FACHB-141]MBD2115084.1 hypothetical protein [Nodosilinea sp. FACHB-141]
MKLQVFFSLLILPALSFFSSVTPAHAGIWDRIQDTVEDVVDPGGNIRDAVEAVQDSVTYTFRVQNDSGREMQFSIGLESYSLSPGYYMDIVSYGSNDFKMYNAPDVEGYENSYVSYDLDNNGSYSIIEEVGGFYELYSE